jgi:hypothetical protein
MTAVTVRATSTHKAMEELLRRLGPDALILSTRHVDGEVEVTAVPPDCAPPAPSPAPAAQPTAQPTASPADFAQAFQRETARSLSCDPQAVLARRLFPSQVLVEDPITRLLIVGPPGAGKSMLACRIAAQLMIADRTVRPHIIAPASGALLVEDRLRGWTRLMGLAPDRPTVAHTFRLPDPTPGRPQIVDLSDIPEDAPGLVASLIETDDAELVLCLPAGLHPARIAKLCHDWQAFTPTVTLTGLDLWWPERAELDAIVAAGLKLTRTAAGTGLIRSLSRPGASDLNRWASGWAPAFAGAAE